MTNTGSHPASTTTENHDIDALFDDAWELLKSDPDQSIARAQEATALAPADTRNRYVARVLIMRAGIEYNKNEVDECIASFDEAVQIGLDEDKWGARAALLGGYIYDNLGKPAEALDNYNRASRIFESLADALGGAKATFGTGSVYIHLGQYSQALDAFRRSHAIAVQCGGMSDAGRALIGSGHVYSTLGDHAKALAVLQQAVATVETLGNPQLLGRALSELATAYNRADDVDAAVVSLQRARECATDAGDVLLAAMIQRDIAACDIERGNYAHARDALREAMSVVEKHGSPLNKCDCFVYMGELECAEGNYDASLDYFRSGLSIAERIDSRISALRVHKGMAASYRELGRYREAFEHIITYRRVDDEIRNEDTLRKTEAADAARSIEVAQKQAEIERLRNVELAEAHDALRSAHSQLEQIHNELANAHDNLKSAQAQLAHAEKMASLGQLTAGIAHEINNPINFIGSSIAPLRRDLDAVRGSVERALDSLTDDERERVEAMMIDDGIEEDRLEIDQLLRGIADGASRTAEIVKGLRTFSRLDEDELKLVDINQGIASTLVLLRSRMGDGIAVKTEYGTIPNVECYPGQINQVFMNILANAIDAIGDERSVGPWVRRSRGEIAVRTWCADSCVRVEIVDNGCGIADEHLPRIFEPFFTTKPVGQGQGLGLAISHGIVARHGGAIEVESTSTNGTTFVVNLPLRHDHAADRS